MIGNGLNGIPKHSQILLMFIKMQLQSKFFKIKIYLLVRYLSIYIYQPSISQFMSINLAIQSQIICYLSLIIYYYNQRNSIQIQQLIQQLHDRIKRNSLQQHPLLRTKRSQQRHQQPPHQQELQRERCATMDQPDLRRYPQKHHQRQQKLQVHRQLHHHAESRLRTQHLRLMLLGQRSRRNSDDQMGRADTHLHRQCLWMRPVIRLSDLLYHFQVRSNQSVLQAHLNECSGKLLFDQLNEVRVQIEFLYLDKTRYQRCNIIKFSIQFYMDYYYNSRLAYELQLSRILDLERQSQYVAALQSLRIAQAREREVRQLIQIERFKQEQKYWNYQVIKNAQLLTAKKKLAGERTSRPEKQKYYENYVEAKGLSRFQRQDEPDPQKRILYSQQRKKSEAFTASRRAQWDANNRLKEQKQREDNYVLQQQKIQQKLQKQLRELDKQIGRIYDAREQRNKKYFEELERLDKNIFKVTQQLRASEVTQQALQQDLLRLSKLIV